MGVISKQIRKRGNQRLAAPLTTSTALTIPEAISVIKGVCEQYNQRVTAAIEKQRTEGSGFTRWLYGHASEQARHYHVVVRKHDVLVGFEATPERILRHAKQKRLGAGIGWWLASVRFPKSSESLPAGMTLVEIRLVSWVMNGDGKIKNRGLYEQLTDMLWEAVSVDSPDAAEPKPNLSSNATTCGQLTLERDLELATRR